MNIVIVDASVATTGAFKGASNMAVSLQEAGHTVTLVLPKHSALLNEADTHKLNTRAFTQPTLRKSLKSLLFYLPSLLFAAVAFKRYLTQQKVDLVISNDYYNLLAAAAKLLGWNGRLITYVRLIPAKQQAQLNALWLAVAARYSESIVAVSRCVLAQLPECPANTLLYDYCDIKPNEPREHSDDSPVCEFVYLGNYIRGKGQEIALQAFHRASTQVDNIRLRFVGGDMGLTKNHHFKAELMAYSADHGMADQLVFDTYSDDVAQVISRADVLVNCSKAESFSMTCLEASSLGRPLIATRCGGPEEIVIDKKTGLLVDVDDIDAVANAMLYLSQRPQLRREFGEAGRQTVAERFSKARFDAGLQALLGGKG